MMTNTFLTGLVTAGLLFTTTLFAQDAAAVPKKGGPWPVARNLDNPSGIAIHPETGHLFVATHKGVIRFTPVEGEKPGLKRKVEIAKYPSDIYGKGPMYDIGPLGLAFLGKDHLVVGDGSRPDGEELVRVYKIGATAPEMPVKEDSAEFTLGPISAGAESAKGEGNYYGVCVIGDAIFTTANGDDTKGWVARAEVKDGKPGELKAFIATKEAVEVDAPVAITSNADGDVVIGQMGEISVPNDGLLSFYDAATGKLKKNYTTGLSDITGLAYSPSGDLFATDFSWADTTKGGLFKLTIEGDKCTATKIADLDKPTAIAFDADGNAYVTAFGTAEEGSDKSPGMVIKFGKRLLK